MGLREVLQAALPHHSIAELLSKYDTAYVKSPEAPKGQVRKRTLSMPPDTHALCAPQCGPHRKYLRSRNFDPDALAEEWDLLGIGTFGGKWAWRIFIPLIDPEGYAIGYQGRAISETVSPKYLTLESENSIASPKSILYGEHQVQGDAVIVVEGATDVWRLGPGAVATLGVDWSPEQANKLRSYDRRFILFDKDRVAQKRARELANWLASAPGRTEVITGLATDPANMAAGEVAELRDDLDMEQNEG